MLRFIILLFAFCSCPLMGQGSTDPFDPIEEPETELPESKDDRFVCEYQLNITALVDKVSKSEAEQFCKRFSSNVCKVRPWAYHDSYKYAASLSIWKKLKRKSYSLKNVRKEIFEELFIVIEKGKFFSPTFRHKGRFIQCWEISDDNY